MGNDTANSEAVGGRLHPLVSPWHVWRVEGYFYAANTIEDAKRLHMHDWGMEEEDLGGWDEEPADRIGYFRKATSHDEIWDMGEDCTLRERAEEMIEAGESLPFMVAVELG